MILMITMMTMIIFMISVFLMILSNSISKKTFMDREKSSPFECGFDPKSSARLSFSLQFFLIALIFLIFDVEITLMIPFILILNKSFIKTYLVTLIFFILILIIGLYHEWNQGALNWSL
uniref:NADH-ubiquinone oxidoreductase chain 3 n=1 Tax=Staphylinidae sp. BMNH 1274637 TaxID=1796580 RepID=A0A126TFX9_9COLE|nr:NADH dehydrogenase subunit 3 [Staphylinidae sp. BMNH 1274637]